MGIKVRCGTVLHGQREGNSFARPKGEASRQGVSLRLDLPISRSIDLELIEGNVLPGMMKMWCVLSIIGAWYTDGKEIHLSFQACNHPDESSWCLRIADLMAICNFHEV